MELTIAVLVVGAVLAVLAGHSAVTRTLSKLLRFTPGWIKRILFGDHIMKVAVGFFAIMLAVMTKVFGP